MVDNNLAAVPQFDGTEDFNAVYDARPKAMQSRPVEVSVVGRRCVYLNNYRIAGGKPYHSENLPTHELTATLGDIINAFSKEDILAAYAEREASSEYMSAWRAARDANAVQAPDAQTSPEATPHAD